MTKTSKFIFLKTFKTKTLTKIEHIYLPKPIWTYATQINRKDEWLILINSKSSKQKASGLLAT